MRRRPSNPVEDEHPQSLAPNAARPESGRSMQEQEIARNGQRPLERRISNKTIINATPAQPWRPEPSKIRESPHKRPRSSQQSPWAFTFLTFSISFAAILFLATMLHSFLYSQHDPKGCAMSYMLPMFAHFSDFDTEHTRFATKYSLYMYREGGIDEDTRVKGIPIIFIPGNAGSYKQVRPIAAEAATHFHNVLREDPAAIAEGKRAFDFFSLDFNEDITAFHGQTLLDQAEYLNEAIAFVLALYHNPARSLRDPDLPEPQSVILIGHSMGGIVARTVMTMPNYQEHSVNTIITLSAPHARPPVSFDAEMVTTYRKINEYWRHSYLQLSADTNPLADVTLVSIAGGGLDTMIPSEYTSLASLVPESHGFTVFTSSIPHVWTSMDHLAIMWCDQFRKAIVISLFDVIDARRRSQTSSRVERITAFRRRLLTGLDSPTLPREKPSGEVMLTLDETSVVSAGLTHRLALNTLGAVQQTTAHLLPLHSIIKEAGEARLLTNQELGTGHLVPLLCKTSHSNQHVAAHVIDVSTSSIGKAQLSCHDVTRYATSLPASYAHSQNAFDDAMPFTYLHLAAHDMDRMEYFVLIEHPSDHDETWAFAEVVKPSEWQMTVSKGHHQLILNGLKVEIPADRSLAMDLQIPEVHSTLFTYEFTVKQSPSAGQKFSPLLRQHIGEPHESKYFVNTRGGVVNVHGVSPYMPPSLRGDATDGLGLQLWTDPTNNATIEVTFRVDRLSSAGKIVMRYRTALAVLPLLVVLIVVRKQFKVYDSTGLFISFSSSMDQCIRTSLPFVFIALTFLAISLSKSAQGGWIYGRISAFFDETETHKIDFSINDLMLGTQDPFLWFLVPLFGIISIGICISANYLIVILMSIATSIYGVIKSRVSSNIESRSPASTSIVSHQRLFTTAVLLLLVTTLVPYQFAYIVLVMVQIATCTKASQRAVVSQTATDYNFYNYTHSMLMLMLWILPINLPVLIVWIHNLAVHWMTPFSTHHNLLAIVPVVLCVEAMSTGNMVPRITGRGQYITNILTFMFALYAAVFGVTYAYRLHYLLNALTTWILVVHLSHTTTGLMSVLSRPLRVVVGTTVDTSEGHSAQARDVKKQP